MALELAAGEVVCVGSRAGLVGKSSVASNLAAALTVAGKGVGVLDADLWRRSIPRMLGVHGRPSVSPVRKVVPLKGPGGMNVVSLEFFLDQEDRAITWRRPTLRNVIRQFLEDVEWGEPDYLLIDLPAGAGDVSRAVGEFVPRAKLVLVTAPREIAEGASDVPDLELETVGVVENMCQNAAPAGERGAGSGEVLAGALGAPLLGKVPLSAPLREQPDAGIPLVISHRDDPAAQALRLIAARL